MFPLTFLTFGLNLVQSFLLNLLALFQQLHFQLVDLPQLTFLISNNLVGLFDILAEKTV